MPTPSESPNQLYANPEAISLARDLTSEAIHLFHSNQLELALETLKEVERSLSFYTPAIAWQIPVLDALNRVDQIIELYDFEHSVMVFNLDEIGQEIFQRRISDAVRRYIVTQVDFGGGDRRMPLVQATISKELVSLDRPVIADLKQLMMVCFRRYLSTKRFLNWEAARLSECWSSMWATKTETSGEIGAHYHPRSWLTATFYPMKNSAPAGQGNLDIGGDLELGHVPTEMGPLKWPQRFKITPREGKVVIFPAYIGHAVTAVRSAECRISIAMDLCVMPPSKSDR